MKKRSKRRNRRGTVAFEARTAEVDRVLRALKIESIRPGKKGLVLSLVDNTIRRIPMVRSCNSFSQPGCKGLAVFKPKKGNAH